MISIITHIGSDVKPALATFLIFAKTLEVEK